MIEIIKMYNEKNILCTKQVNTCQRYCETYGFFENKYTSR